MRTVFLQDPDGGADIELKPSLDTWLKLEAKFGGSLGALVIQHSGAMMPLAAAMYLIQECARNADPLVDREAVRDRIYRLGLIGIEEPVSQLLKDIVKPRDTGDEPPPEAEETEAETVPLAGGA